MEKAFEVNFDGLVGPTHNYAGLSFGNVASLENKTSFSNPKEAALQGLEKMKALASLGLKQAVFPPQQRPDLHILRQLGFSGDAETILKKVRQESPDLLSAVWSSSSMWTANAATVAPSADTEDQKVHFTPANLSNKFHRSLEPETTGRILQAIFNDSQTFVHHVPLPAGNYFSDEGAANHTRFADRYQNPGVEFFVYGRKAFGNENRIQPKKFPARQTYEASSAIARRHRLKLDQVIFGQQSPEAIDAGAFHNDVVSVGNLNVLFYHEEAFLNTSELLRELDEKFQKTCSQKLMPIRVSSSQVSLQDAIRSYLFNSQLISLSDADNSMALIAPVECQENASVRSFLAELLEDRSQPLREVHYFDLRQSMRNGGGPACLRLRVVLTETEISRTHSKVFLDEELYTKLVSWVNQHYRDRLSLDDLVDPKLIFETERALDDLTQILGIGSIYPFQLNQT